MSESTWRAKSKVIIHRVLEETAGYPESKIRKALREAYPFGERKYHPYKIWLNEIARQRGMKKPRKKWEREQFGQLTFGVSVEEMRAAAKAAKVKEIQPR